MKHDLLAFLTLLTSMNSLADEDDLIFRHSFDPCDQQSCCNNQTIFAESFPDGSQNLWGGQWELPGFEIDTAEIVNGEARLVPVASGYSLARIVHPFTAQDVEVNFTVTFENATTQGVGFYVRANGGYLDQTNPAGEGYAVFIEKFRTDNGVNIPGLGVWYEHDGTESSLLIDFNQTYELNDEVPYRVKFQVYQLNPTQTQLRAKLWATGQAEPVNWQVTFVDDYAPLQNTSGHIAVDSWSTQQNGAITAGTRIDDIEIKSLCNPLLNYPTVSAIDISDSGHTLQFAEGPVWHNGHWLFSDIAASRIYQWEPLLGLQVFNTDSGQSNGLATNSNNMIITAEHFNRRIGVDNGSGTLALVEEYLGNQFNSPNDLIFSDQGFLYFTDPDYGLDGRPREIAFNGIYSWHPTSGITAEYMGDQFNNQPNGIGLSPDQQTLYWTDSAAGEFQQMTVDANGNLTDLSLIDSNLTIPDGLCIDAAGNVFVATWNGALEVYAADGGHWGSLSVPENNVTNCAFGGVDGRTLFVTSQLAIHSAGFTP